MDGLENRQQVFIMAATNRPGKDPKIINKRNQTSLVSSNEIMYSYVFEVYNYPCFVLKMTVSPQIQTFSDQIMCSTFL